MNGIIRAIQRLRANPGFAVDKASALRLIEVARIEIEPVTASQAHNAREAYRDFGKGGKHPAGLNFGDCFAYALAKETGEPLLFKGGDFAQTDVVPVI